MCQSCEINHFSDDEFEDDGLLLSECCAKEQDLSCHIFMPVSAPVSSAGEF